MRNPRLSLLVPVLLLAAARPSSAQPAPGVEFLVNSVTTLSQQHPRVARQFGPPGPGFIVTWENGGTGAVVLDIAAATFDALGVKQVPDFHVNSYTTNFQSYPAVAGEYDGSFTVSWESHGQNEVNYGIYARRYSANGSPQTAELLVSTYTTGSQRHPSVAPSSGKARLVFDGPGIGDASGVFFAVDPFGSQILVNSYTPGAQTSSAVSAGIALSPTSPDYLIVWRGNGVDDADQGIYGRVYDGNGNAVTADFRVNATTAGGQTLPAVAADAFATGFVVVWENPTGGGSLRDVYAQRLEANGAPRGPQFRVNTYTTGNQDQPQVAVDDWGNFVVVWSSYQDGSNRSVHAQAYFPDGRPRGAEFLLNTFHTGAQRMPSVAATGAQAEFIVVWQSAAQESPTSLEGVYARLFKVPSPVGDATGDGVVDVQDVFSLINFLFAGGTGPVGSGDVNGDLTVNATDVFYLINFLFAGGPAPV